MPDRKPQLRCAAYTRKSTEEGLEKDFNSLDAQREACEAYILSQRHEGWSLLADHYDDGGFSGGSMERPALARLLERVRAGQVDVVVVYKIDRLTRSLADFAKIVEIFEEADCSFVSVTQSFNTTSSMGRLTLNVLLSFAQFEREVAAERIRDKIAASKKRGMWMGGPLPLGYDVKDRKLIIVPEEATTVRDIMHRYLKSDGVPALVEELERGGIVSKTRKMRDGSIRGGTPFRRGALAHLLSNRIYLGLITHKGEAYEGEHKAIVDQELFDAVQSKLARRGIERRTKMSSEHVSILAGRISDHHGRAMTPTNTQRHGKRYRYYASIPRDGSKQPSIRLPAAMLERSVVDALATLLKDQERLQAIAKVDPLIDMPDMLARAEALASRLERAGSLELQALLARLNLAICAGSSEISAELGLGHLVMGRIEGAEKMKASLSIPTVRSTCAQEPRLKLEPPTGPERVDEALVNLIARAFASRDELLAMDQAAVTALPIRQRRHMERTARLSYLAPDIICAILDGHQPTHLSARSLMRRASLPNDWAAQREMLGFAAN